MKFLSAISFSVLATTPVPELDLDSFNLFEGIGMDETIPERASELEKNLLRDGGLYAFLSPSNRVSSSPTLEQEARLDTVVVEGMRRHGALDKIHDAFTPQLVVDSIHEFTPFGKVTLSHPIARTFSYIDVAVRENPRLMIRYSHDCNGMPFTPVVHPMMQDYIYGKEAEKAQVGLTYFFVSSPAAFPFFRNSRKLSFHMDDSTFYSCRFAEATVRYAIMERPDESLRMLALAAPGRKLDFSYSMNIAQTLVGMIQSLHEREIVHGNINVDSINLVRVSDHKVRLRFTDFKYSRMIRPDTGLAIFPFREKNPSLPRAILYSPNELAARPSYGTIDDVFRIVETVAICTQNLAEYRQNLRDRLANGTLPSWKSTDGSLFGDLRNIPTAVREEVRTRLDQIMALVRRTDVPMPDYENLIRLFQELESITRPRSVVLLTTPAPAVDLTVVVDPIETPVVTQASPDTVTGAIPSPSDAASKPAKGSLKRRRETTD